VGLRFGFDAVEEKNLAEPGMENGPSRQYLIDIPTEKLNWDIIFFLHRA
jgi:hypothetical protein